jgi:ribosomal protein L32
MSRKELELAYKKIRTLISERDKHISELEKGIGITVCDCHTWPTIKEFHDYVVALEAELKKKDETIFSLKDIIRILKKNSPKLTYGDIKMQEYEQMDKKPKPSDDILSPLCPNCQIELRYNECPKCGMDWTPKLSGDKPPELTGHYTYFGRYEVSIGDLLGWLWEKYQYNKKHKSTHKAFSVDNPCDNPKCDCCHPKPSERDKDIEFNKDAGTPSDGCGECEIEKYCRPRWCCKACGAGPCYFGGEWPHVCAQDGETKSDWVQIKPDDELPSEEHKHHAIKTTDMVDGIYREICSCGAVREMDSRIEACSEWKPLPKCPNCGKKMDWCSGGHWVCFECGYGTNKDCNSTGKKPKVKGSEKWVCAREVRTGRRRVKE